MPVQDPQLSLVLIAYNEADRIGRALDSVPFADEKIVIDSGSTDATVEIACAHGARVIHQDWLGFTAQKNFGLARARGAFVLSLDADEWLSPLAAAEVQGVLLTNDRTVGAWSSPRCSSWRGREIRHGLWYPDRRIRLVRRVGARWIGPDPHDRLIGEGLTHRLNGDICHQPYRSTTEQLQTMDRYSRVHAQALRELGVEARAWDPAVHGSWHFVRAYLLRQGFRDGSRGLALATLGAVHSALKWKRLRAMQ